jgi:two-component system, cell cycle sensor histidine kinase and response regulator CckA
LETLRLSFSRKPIWLTAAALFLATVALFGWLAVEHTRVPDRVYRIGWQADPPFQTRGSNGEASDLAIDLVRAAARRRGVQLEWVERPEGGEAALLAKNVDLWPFLTVTPERLEIVHISDPFLETELCLLVPAASRFTSVPDLSRAAVSVHDMPINLRWVHATLPDARLLPVPSSRDAVNQVCQGSADAAFLEKYTAVEDLLSGGSCANVPLRWINVPGRRSRLGIGSTFEATAAADAIRDEIGTMAADGTLESALGQWGYMSGLHLENVQELLNAGRRETRLKWVLALFAVLLALTLWQAVRIHRERERTVSAKRSQHGTEERLRLMADNLTQMVLAYDMNRKLTYANPAVQTLVGYSPAELQQAGFIDWVHPDDRERMHALWEGLYRGQSFREVEYRLVAKDGTVKWANATWGPILDESGRQVGVQGSERDITERKLAEEALRESERRFRGLLENVQLSALMMDLDGHLTFCNDYILKATGWAREELIGHSVTEFMVPEDRARVAGLIQALRSDTAPSHWTAEPGILAKNGKVRHFQAYSLVLRDALGKPVGVANIGADITDVRALQEQYLQAQKMEGLGRLAGGVAHDFNNLLTVINGYSEIIFRKLKEDDPLRANADEIRKAGARAADLTRQLLTFSRKQVSQPKPLDLSLVVADSQEMWKRLLGEAIRLVIRLNPAVGQVMADAGQIHQVLMNLVVNARDAMPQGGTLVIETSDFEVDAAYVAAIPEAVQGSHVLLAVSDTGVGMDDETRQRIFEPFFTTKPMGEGSGLGLATVFGIVKQSHGWIDVYSEPGMGSTFKVYLPRIQSAEAAAESAAPVRSSEPCWETILLVEDQEEVRSLAKNILEEQGYRVLATASAPAAVELAESYSGAIHLLLADVVLPGMSSGELAGRVIAMRPEIRVLFTSGYTHEAAALRTALDRGTGFLPKPYLPDTMAAKVRELLDGGVAA